MLQFQEVRTTKMKPEFKSVCCTSANYLYCVMCEKRSTCKTALALPNISKKFVQELELTHYSYMESKNEYESFGEKNLYDRALMKYYLEELKRLDSKLNYAVMFISSNKKKA